MINARRGPLPRLALALHIGFVRMTGATLDAYQYVPQILIWSPLGKHLGAPCVTIDTVIPVKHFAVWDRSTCLT